MEWWAERVESSEKELLEKVVEKIGPKLEIRRVDCLGKRAFG